MIKIMYSCHLCGLKKVKLMVRERREDENVASWLEEVVASEVGRDHGLRTRGCSAKKISEIYVTTH